MENRNPRPQEGPSCSKPSSMCSQKDGKPSLEGGLEEREQKRLEMINTNRHNMVLDLSLSSRDPDKIKGYNTELDLIASFHTKSSSEEDSLDSSQGNNNNNNNNNNSNNNNDTEPRVFSCNYCQRKFYSSQALGGHQNAHKRERTLAKRGQRIAASSSLALGHLGNRYYSSMASLPLHGTFNRSLGIQSHSMIHKPTSFLPSSNVFPSSLSVHNGWSTRHSLDQQPAIGRLMAQENCHTGITKIDQSSSPPSSSSSTSSNRVARLLGGGRKFSPAIEGIATAGYCWNVGLSNLAKTKQEYDLEKLDLSLKL